MLKIVPDHVLPFFPLLSFEGVALESDFWTHDTPTWTTIVSERKRRLVNDTRAFSPMKCDISSYPPVFTFL